MTSKTSCIIGHRNAEFNEIKIKKLTEFFENLIVNNNVEIFLFGSRSNFDFICHKIVTELKAKYSFIQRKCYTCRSETCTLESERTYWEKAYSNFYKKEVQLLGIEKEVEFKDMDSEFKIAIVVDMWLTGFDVPGLGTMYVDKPMKAHNLMQAIARVNRVYKDKQGGLIVDYIGLKRWLLDALKTYTKRDQGKIVDNSELVKVLMDKVELIRDLFNGFYYGHFATTTDSDKYEIIMAGLEMLHMSITVEH